MDQYLQVFVKVVEKENFSKVASELHMTQPAVSQYIKALEEAVGTRLLERSNKFVRMNKAGEVVYQHAKEILALYAKMQSSLDDLTNQRSGPITIGASYTFGEYILPSIIVQLKKQFPEIHPTITIHNTKDICELVATHQLDIGIIEGPCHDKKLNIEIISEDHMYVVASPQHPLVKMDSVLFSDLKDETWILREKGSGTRQAADNLFETHGFIPQNILEFGSTQLIKESVEAGLGISLLSSWAIEKERLNGYIDIIPVTELPFKRSFSIVTQTIYQTKVLETFISLVKSAVLPQNIL